MWENEEKSKNLMNIVMQLWKVCNHPDLFEWKLVWSPFYFSDLTGNSYYNVHIKERLAFLTVNKLDNPLSTTYPDCLNKFLKDSLVAN